LSWYLIRTIVPYFFFSWVLLSVILFVQQASRFSDIFFSANIPSGLVWQLMIALIPNVIAFTCPMAVLVGTVIGLSKMQGDSELVAIRAAGVGNLHITVPIAVLGILLSGFAFLVNLKGVPIAAALVRQVALRTAIQKLESPIEPGIFNTEIAGYTIYVQSGDIASGRWNNIFVFQKDAGTGGMRVITSREGRIDVSDQLSELVLEDATVFTLPAISGNGKYVSEKIGDVRFAIKTRRNELVEKLTTAQGGPEEMGLSQLSEYAATREGSEGREAQILWQRRLLLSMTPLIFCLLGAAMVLRLSRGGRGVGTLLSLGALIVYYLVTFLGEQLVRVGNVTPIVGGLMPVVLSIAAILWLNLTRPSRLFTSVWHRLSGIGQKFRNASGRMQARNIFVDLTTGLRDLDILTNFVKYFIFSLAFTGSIFVIFTAFELWKFAGTMESGITLLVKYLFFLGPFIYLQLAPTSIMIAILATYIIKARNNELVTWMSAGQSIYRLLAPSLVICVGLGLVNWIIQENVLPRANRIQDGIRTEIRNRGSVASQGGRYWLAQSSMIYSFELARTASDNESVQVREDTGSNRSLAASDNENHLANLIAFSFSGEERKLQDLYRAERAILRGGEIHIDGPYQKVELRDTGVTVQSLNTVVLPAKELDLAFVTGKPSHLASSQLRDLIAQSDSETESRMLSVLLQRRYSNLALPLMIALITAPFALNLSRKGKVLMAGYAVGLWLMFIGLANVFEQWGYSGVLSPAVSVWSPILIFASIGIYMLSKIRT
jgi:lipopolysaccharide export LptBFGC system permease protein LptF